MSSSQQQRHLPFSNSSSSIYDSSLDAFLINSHPDSTTRQDALGLGDPYMPSPIETAKNSSHPMRYAFAQAFGERGVETIPQHQHSQFAVHDSDMISAVRFNETSDMIATGDKGGRIVLLKRVRRSRAKRRRRNTRRIYNLRSRGMPFSPHHSNNALQSVYNTRADHTDTDTDIEDDDDPDEDDDHDYKDVYQRDEDINHMQLPEFRFWTQFQSHEPEFDYLKSMEIEEKINQVRWCRQVCGGQRLIATNDKTIKLWRVFEKDVKRLATMDPQSLLQAKQQVTTTPISNQYHNNLTQYSPDAYELRVPRLEIQGRVIAATARRVFSNAHAYHINSISLNSDEETFLSADDLRINLWNLNTGGTGFNILDIKPGNMEDLSEVITAAEFHPRHCHLFMHSSSRGIVKLCDLRSAAHCEKWAREFEEIQDGSSRSSFFSEIIASISDVKFSRDGRYILTRDYMNLRLWDMNMERQPILTIPVHEHLQTRLCDLYENDCIFDKFQCCFSSDGGSMLTGSYSSLFQSYSCYNGSGSAVEANVDFVSGLTPSRSGHDLNMDLIAGCSAQDLVDASKRIMYLDASPTEEIAAVAAGPALYLYHGLT